MLLFFVCISKNRTFSFWYFFNQTFLFRFEKTFFYFADFTSFVIFHIYLLIAITQQTNIHFRSKVHLDKFSPYIFHRIGVTFIFYFCYIFILAIEEIIFNTMIATIGLSEL